MIEQIKEPKVEDIKVIAETKVCPVQKALYYITEFIDSGPMCGRCFPCALGSYEARIRLQNLVTGKGTEDDLHKLKRIAEDMIEASFCKKGKDTGKFILDWMTTDIYKEHVKGRCPDMKCKSMIEYRIIPEKCTMCGECKDVCREHAIHGEKKKPFQGGYLPFEIRQMRCTKCGECIKVCPEGAIVLIEATSKEPVEV